MSSGKPRASQNKLRARLEDIAHTVHRQVQVPEHIKRYLSMIQAYVRRLSGGWTSDAIRQSLRQAKPDRTDGEVEAELHKLRATFYSDRLISERRQQGLGITTGAAVPMDQRYASLAAVHEGWCPCRGFTADWWFGRLGVPEPLFESVFEGGATDADWDAHTERMNFYALVEDAKTMVTASLTEQQVAGLETMLAEVDADLAGDAAGDGGNDKPYFVGTTDECRQKLNCSHGTIRNRARDGNPIGETRVVKRRNGLYALHKVGP